MPRARLSIRSAGLSTPGARLLIGTAGRLLPLLVLALAAGLMPLRAQSAPAEEAQIRAAILFNLARFIEWPAWKLKDEHAPFVIGLLGNDPIAPELNALLQGKQVQGRAVTVRRISSTAQAEDCHLLYVPLAERKHLADMMPALSRAAVLTVSDHTPAAGGTVIGLPLVDSSIQIQVDLKAAQSSGLTVSSKVLRIAVVSR